MNPIRTPLTLRNGLSVAFALGGLLSGAGVWRSLLVGATVRVLMSRVDWPEDRILYFPQRATSGAFQPVTEEEAHG